MNKMITKGYLELMMPLVDAVTSVPSNRDP
jgi:hypothetical protein